MSTDHCLILITCGGADEARAIARRLVEGGFAAGAQMVPISSIYTWRGETVEDEEILLICKTRSDRFPDIEALVTEMHSYEVPPIVQVSIDRANGRYLDWIDAATGR